MGQEDEESPQRNSGAMGCLWAIVILVAIGWFVNKLWNDYQNGEKKPFWKGTELLQVCRTPYYSSKDCYKLNVTLVDDKTAQINFSNGGYKISRDLTCYFAAKSFPDEPKYIFCRSWDSDGQQWDFMPAWAYYPSMEELTKRLEKFKK